MPALQHMAMRPRRAQNSGLGKHEREQHCLCNLAWVLNQYVSPASSHTVCNYFCGKRCHVRTDAGVGRTASHISASQPPGKQSVVVVVCGQLHSIIDTSRLTSGSCCNTRLIAGSLDVTCKSLVSRSHTLTRTPSRAHAA
jgi:hypothetical protein